MDSIRTTLRYDADLTSAIAQIRALTAQVGALNMAFNSLDKQALTTRNTLASTFAANLTSMGGFNTKMVDLTSSTREFGKALANNRLTMREYFGEAYRGLTRQQSMMKQLAREQVRMQQSITVPVGRTGAGGMQGMVVTPQQLDLTRTTTRMQLLNQEFSIFRQLVNNGAESLINMGKNTQWTGRQLTVGLTMPVVLLGAAFAKTFMDIDKELTRFAKVYGQDVVGSNMRATEDMKNQVIDLAETISSRLGVAMKDTVALAADVAATGKEGQDLIGTVEQTTRLAVLGEVDRQEAMKATLAIQTAFKQNTEELADSINFLNAVENQTSTTLNDLVEAIPKAGPVVKGLGGSIQDLSVLMVAMKEGGIPAAEAANAIKSGLASLINPTKKASEVAKQFGVDLVGIVEANRGQLMPTLLSVQDALAGLDSFSRSRVIEEIFGKYQFARISALFNNLGKAGSQTQQAMELAGASTADLAGIANQELKAYTESTTVRFQRMVETVKNQIIPMAGTLLEMLIPALEKVSSFIDLVKSGFDNLPSFMKEPIKLLGAAVLIAGPVLMLVGLFKNLIGNAIKFGMAFVTLGAKMRGIDTKKFELLDEQAVAAKVQVDNLSTSFEKQQKSVMLLNEELRKYLRQLQSVAASNPGMMSGPAPSRPMPLRRRAAGSTGPEMVPGGYGGGDKIPALLEPGEMVIRKEAVAKYQPILGAMNAGTLQGFVRSTRGQTVGQATGKKKNVSVHGGHTTMPFAIGTPQHATGMVFAAERFGADFIDFYNLFGRVEGAIQVLSKSVALLPSSLNLKLRTGASIEDFRQGWNMAGPSKYAATAVGGGFDLKEEGANAALERFEKAVRDESIRLAKETKEKKVTDEILAKAQANVIAKSKNLASSTDAVDVAYRKLARAVAIQAARVGAVTLSATPQMVAAHPEYFGKDDKGNLMFGKDPKNRTLLVKTSETSESKGGTRARGIREKVPAYLAGGYATVTDERRTTARSLGINPALLGPLGTLTAAPSMKIGTAVPSMTRGSGGGGYLSADSALKVLKAARRDAERVGDMAAVQFIDGLIESFKSTLGIKSPSKRLRDAARREGKNSAEGFALGAQEGFEEASERLAKIGLQEGRQAASSLVSGIQRGMDEIAAKRAAATASLGQTRTQRIGLESNLASAQARMANMGPGFAATPIGAATRKQIEIYEKQILALKQQELRDEKYINSLNAAESKLAQKKVELERQIIQLTEVERQQAAQAAAVPNQAGVMAPVAGGGGAGMGGAMNAMFGLSMVMSTMTMFGDQTSAATSALSQFSMALMAVSSLMMFMPQGGGFFGKRKIDPDTGLKQQRNLLGMSSVGESMMRRSGKFEIDARTGEMFKDRAGKPIPAMGGRGAGGSSKLAMLGEFAFAIGTKGGPYVAAAVIAIAAVTAAIIQYNRAAEEARLRTVAAFSEPIKTAEAFGMTIQSTTDRIKAMNNEYRLRAAGEEEPIDPTLLEAVRQDYGMLIEKIKYQSAEAGAQELGMAFNRMLFSGLDAEKAKRTVMAIAQEAGMAGGTALTEAMSQGLLEEKSIKDAISETVDSFDPKKNVAFRKILEGQKEIAEETKGNMISDALQPTNFIPVVGPAITFFKNIGSNVAEKGFFSGFAETMLQSNPVLNSIGTALAQANWLPDFANILVSDEVEALQAQAQVVDQLKNDIMEASDVSSTQMVAVAKQMSDAFEQAPVEATAAFRKIATAGAQSAEVAFDIKPVQDFLTEIDETVGPTVTRMIQAFSGANMALQEGLSNVIMRAVGTARVPIDRIYAIMQDVERFERFARIGGVKMSFVNEDAERAYIAERMAEEISLITRFTKKLQEAQLELEKSTERLKAFATDGALSGIIKAEETELAGIIKARDDYVKSREQQKQDLADAHEASQQLLEDEVDALNDQKDQIDKSTDAYLKSIEKRKKAEGFYADQRKSSLSALSKLAEGDIFGFLQEREDMQANAVEFAYDKEIEKINERKEAELEAIDEVIKKKNEQKKDADRNHKDAMKMFDDETKRMTAEYEKQITAKRQTIGEMRKIAEAIAEGNIESEERVTAVFGEEAGKRYRRRFEEMIADLALTKQKEILLAETREQSRKMVEAAQKSLRDLYGQFSGLEFLDVYDVLTADQALGKILPGGLTFKEREFAPGPKGRPIDTRDLYAGGNKGLFPQITSASINAQSVAASTQTMTVTATGPITINGGTTAAQGGYITGPGTSTSDSIPAMLSNGEFVIRASSVDKYGVGFMNSINSGGFNPRQSFAMGGIAGMFGANMKRASMPSYALGGMVGPSFEGSSSGDMYNIVINANSVTDPEALANMVMSKIQSEKNRRSHTRVI